MHPLRGVHEHLPRLPAQRRAFVRRDGAGADRVVHIWDTAPGKLIAVPNPSARNSIAVAGKVLFTTGYARNAIVHHGRLDPGVQLITKPFTFDDLAAKVRDVLDQEASSLGTTRERA